MKVSRRNALQLFLSVGLTGPSFAADRDDIVALSIGNSHYLEAQTLPSAIRDAQLVGRVFAALGIKTHVVTDLTREEVLVSLARLRVQAANSKLVLIYVAGHGALTQNRCHFFPIDGYSSGSQQGIPEELLIKAVSDKNRQKILFLDCCQSPFETHPNGAKMMDRPSERAGVHISYAAQAGGSAIDGNTQNSPYARALANALLEPGLAMEELDRKVRLDVIKSTNGLQIPWSRSSLLTSTILHP